jgi:hypothetical protein
MGRIVPAIPIIGHFATPIEIAGTSLDKPGDDAGFIESFHETPCVSSPANDVKEQTSPGNRSI